MTFAFDAQLAQAMLAMRGQGDVAVPPPGDWRGLRESLEPMLAALEHASPSPADVRRRGFQAISLDGTPIPLRWYEKDGATPGSAVLYLHGGGMILGSVDLYDSVVSNYVSRSGVPMLSVDYRLAPEHPHPVPVEDCYAGLDWLVGHAADLDVDPTRIGVMGDSAGGGLAAAVALLARDRGIALARQVLVYPMLDDRNTTPDPALVPFAAWTYDNNLTGWTALLGDATGGPEVAPSAAPARAMELNGVAPAYIEVGELDIFRDEDVEYARRIAGAGISVELQSTLGRPTASNGWRPPPTSRRAPWPIASASSPSSEPTGGTPRRGPRSDATTFPPSRPICSAPPGGSDRIGLYLVYIVRRYHLPYRDRGAGDVRRRWHRCLTATCRNEHVDETPHRPRPRRTGRRRAAGARLAPRRFLVMSLRSVLDRVHMPECPRWRDGTLWMTDIWGHQVLQIGADGSRRVMHEFPEDEDPAGLGWLPDGRLLVVGMLGRVVYVVDGNDVAVHADLRHLAPFPLNDMIVADDGTAYVSGFGWDVWGGGTYADNALIRVRRDGRIDTVAEAMMAPNGIALAEDGRTLVVAESAGGRLSRFTVTSDGDLADRHLIPIEKAPGAAHVTPDGICLDAEGAVWAADPIGLRVIRILADGALDRVIPIDGGYPLACVLGGPERRTLFIAIGAATSKTDRPAEAGGRLVAIDVDVPGAGRP